MPLGLAIQVVSSSVVILSYLPPADLCNDFSGHWNGPQADEHITFGDQIIKKTHYLIFSSQKTQSQASFIWCPTSKAIITRYYWSSLPLPLPPPLFFLLWLWVFFCIVLPQIHEILLTISKINLVEPPKSNQSIIISTVFQSGLDLKEQPGQLPITVHPYDTLPLLPATWRKVICCFKYIYTHNEETVFAKQSSFQFYYFHGRPFLTNNTWDQTNNE